MPKTRLFNCCLITLAFLVIFPVAATAQGKMENLPNLVMPTFTESVVKLKTGDSYTAVMNYEMLEQEMIVLKEGLYYILQDKQLVDTITINNRKFVPFDKGFNEVLAEGPVSLFYEYKCILESTGGLVPYDTRSTAGGLARGTTNYGLGGTIELRIPENYKVVEGSETWVRKDGIMHRISTRKQFMKLFEDREEDLNRFIKQNRTDFRNTDDLTKLVNYCNQLY
jgi:hypothetical protein